MNLCLPLVDFILEISFTRHRLCAVPYRWYIIIFIHSLTARSWTVLIREPYHKEPNYIVSTFTLQSWKDRPGSYTTWTYTLIVIERQPQAFIQIRHFFKIRPSFEPLRAQYQHVTGQQHFMFNQDNNFSCETGHCVHSSHVQWKQW